MSEHHQLEDENLDEKISAQQLEIEKEVAQEQPLVSIRYELNMLIDEYETTDDVYRKKLQDLCLKYKYIRKTRRDGNCFFRAFGFAFFESVMGKKTEIENLKKTVNKCTSDLISIGYHAFTVEDFRDVFLENLDKLADSSMNIEGLENIFNDSGLSDYIVVFLRLIVSCYLQMNSEFFLSFIDTYATMKEFCSHEVEPMYRESDHIHIIALTNAINVPVSIIYLDRTDQEKATPHNFPEDSQPNIFILYRPGHYDIIYN